MTTETSQITDAISPTPGWIRKLTIGAIWSTEAAVYLLSIIAPGQTVDSLACLGIPTALILTYLALRVE
jgi:hypothetical protein